MKILATILFMSFNLQAQVPQDWITPVESFHNEVSELPQTSKESFQQIVNVHDEILSKNSFNKPNLRLDRFDVEVGVNAKGDVGVLALGAQSAIEFIWTRKTNNTKTEITETVEIATDDQEIIFQELENRIQHFIDFQKIGPKKRMKIIKLLRQDAFNIGILIREMATMPRIGDWYVDGFFKIYTFSASGNILTMIEGSADKRIRFRFSFSSIPMRKSEEFELKGSQRFHQVMMKSLNQISRMENPQAKFRLTRARARTEFDHEMDLIFFQASHGYSLQPVYMKVPDQLSLRKAEDFITPDWNTENELTKPFGISEKIVNAVEGQKDREFELSQIRTKFSFRSGVGFWLSTVEKNAVLDLHFLRQRPSGTIITAPNPRTPRLTNIDYRQRLGLSVKIPELGKVRARTSLEHRYRVR